MRYFLLVSILSLSFAAYAGETIPIPAPPTLEQQQKMKSDRYKALSDAAAADQKQRDAAFEKHRRDVKKQEQK